MPWFKKIYVRETLQVNGASTYTGGVTYAGAVTMSDTLNVTGKITASSDIEASGRVLAATGSAGGVKVGADLFLTRGGAGELYYGITAGETDATILLKQIVLETSPALHDLFINRQAAGTIGIGATSGARDGALQCGSIDTTGNAVIGGDLTVNGTTVTMATANVLVEDKLITLNDGGAAGSGAGVGIEVEEDSAITGYVKVNAGRTGWEFLAPLGTGTAAILPGGTSTLSALTVGTSVKPGAITGNIKTQFFVGNPTIGTAAAYEEQGTAIGTWAASGGNFLVTAASAPDGGRVAANSLHFVCAGAAADGDSCADTRASVNWGGADMVGMWIWSRTGLAAGDVNFYLNNGAGGGHAAVNELDLGVVTANTWTFLRLDISAWTAATTTDDVEAIGFMLTAQGAAKSLEFDVNHISRWDDTNTTALPQQVLYGSIHGAYYTGDQAADVHTAVAAVENTDYIINYSATGNEFISITDLSAQILFMSYSYV